MIDESARSFILGIVQGLTEFLPVSSSGHLVIGQHLLGLAEPDLLLDTVLHAGTLLAALIFLRPQLSEIAGALARLPGDLKRVRHWREDAGLRWLVFVVVASIPTAIVGLAFEESFERMFGSVLVVGIMLCVTGVMLLSTLRFLARDPSAHLGIARAFLIGLAQSVAITPGISRSGATISAALFLGVHVEEAARFSFLASVPAILGATALQIAKIDAMDSTRLVSLSVGFLAAAVSGYVALAWLFALLRKRRFPVFGIYCLTAGLITIGFALTLEN
ncbi:undecaprenyl-diphosphate phosphatase [bacterium]|nr:undecaprenyl-diphosphate phosphatase [bacterium]